MRRHVVRLAVLAAVMASTARAIVIFGGNGTQNLTTPASNPGWENVGSIGGLTGVYLGNYGGNYWVATAAHVGANTITLGGTNYSVVGGSAVTIRNSDTSLTDLTLFRISSDPGLGTLQLASAAPVTNSVVRLVGNGSIESTYTKYDVSGTTWTVSPTDPFDAHGYTTTSSAGKRWGDAYVGGTANYTLGGVTSNGVFTTFDPLTGSSQAAVGDSGGAMFSYNGSSWELAGILSAVATFEGQPAGTAMVGNLTFGVNIANYRSAILTAIPEPADFAVWISAAAGAFVAWRRRRRRHQCA